MMEIVARELIPPLREDPTLYHPAENEGDDDFIAPGPLDELLRDRRVVLERRNALTPPAEQEASALDPTAPVLSNERPQPAGAHDEPPPRYTREPAGPRHVSSCTGHDSERSLTIYFRVSRCLILRFPGVVTQSV